MSLQTDRQPDRQAGKHAGISAYIHACRRIQVLAGHEDRSGQAGRKVDRWAGWQVVLERQMDM